MPWQDENTARPMKQIRKKYTAMRRNRKGHNEALAVESYKQVHETTRAAFEKYVGWFTFFVTVNFGSLAWLTKGARGPDVEFLRIIGCAFILFAILGLRSSLTIVDQVIAANAAARQLLGRGKKGMDPTYVTIPTARYVENITLMQIALIVICLLWVTIIVMKA